MGKQIEVSNETLNALYFGGPTRANDERDIFRVIDLGSGADPRFLFQRKGKHDGQKWKFIVANEKMVEVSQRLAEFVFNREGKR
jgi:hypothetical protein